MKEKQHLGGKELRGNLEVECHGQCDELVALPGIVGEEDNVSTRVAAHNVRASHRHLADTPLDLKIS